MMTSAEVNAYWLWLCKMGFEPVETYNDIRGPVVPKH